MNNIFLVLFVIYFSVIPTGCSQNTIQGEPMSKQPAPVIDTNKYKSISPSEARQKLDTDKTIVLLDVRTQEEYKEGHIPGSILIPLDILESEVSTKIKDKNTTVFVYCRSGRRSRIASETLAGLGYKNVYDLGGIMNWPYSIEK